MTKYYKRTLQGLVEVSVIEAQALRDGEKVRVRENIKLIQAINPEAMFCDECYEDLRDCECKELPF